ncbi:MAG: hypothetical protein ACOC7S_02130 [Planctomycetota bacterium]
MFRRCLVSVRLVAAAAVILLVCAGCGLFATPLPDYARHSRGVVRMNPQARNHLALLEHTWRRDERGHLVACIRLRNIADDPFEAAMRVTFFTEDGTPEKEVTRTDRQQFPGFGQIVGLEWTSDTPEAARYVVEIDGTGLLPW